MPIDTWEPYYGRYRGRGEARAAGTKIYEIATTPFLVSMKDLLASCGWAVSLINARGLIPYPLGAPFVSGVPLSNKTLAPCSRGPFLKFGGKNFISYNPLTETPRFDCGEENIFFAWGFTPAGTLGSLADAITGATDYIGSVGPDGINIVAKRPGPLWNFPQNLPDGTWGIPSPINGGGYSCTSAPGQGLTQFTVEMTAIRGENTPYAPTDGLIQWRFTSGAASGGDAIYQTQVHSVSGDGFMSVTMLASGHGFAVFDPRNDAHPNAPSSIFCSAVQIPTGFIYAPSFFVVGPGRFRHTMSAWNVASTLLGGGINAIDSNGPYPRPIFARTPGVELDTLAGVPLIQGAYVGFGGHQTDQVWVVGRIPECIISSQYMEANGGGLILDGKKYEVVSSQNGSGSNTSCSLLWRYE